MWLWFPIKNKPDRVTQVTRCRRHTRVRNNGCLCWKFPNLFWQHSNARPQSCHASVSLIKCLIINMFLYSFRCATAITTTVTCGGGGINNTYSLGWVLYIASIFVYLNLSHTKPRAHTNTRTNTRRRPRVVGASIASSSSHVCVRPRGRALLTEEVFPETTDFARSPRWPRAGDSS